MTPVDQEFTRKPVIVGKATLYRGDVLDVLRTMPDSSVDSVVTDPPYELGFMGKAWDASGIAYNVEMWREALRVLKPGGHLLAFSGSRTYHRMTCAIEDAGFEIRDQIMWVYGSGFPKSLDVSKAMDKTRHARSDVLRATGWIASHAKARVLDDAAGTNGMGGHWTTQGALAAIPTAEAWERIRHLLPEPPEWFVDLIKPARMPGEAWAQREVVGTAKGAGSSNTESLGVFRQEYDKTAPATAAARQWEGWGTALKPAHEPICVARKPLVGTVAANVLAFGTGALNIAACRVEPTGESRERAGEASQERRYTDAGGTNFAATPGVRGGAPEGRWPANLIHDGSDEVLSAFPDAKGQQGATAARSQGDVYGTVNHGLIGVEPRNDTGSAARFFYCPKASRADRNEGLPSSANPAVATDATMRECENANWSKRNGNHHPTVKPTDLMAYLCRLVTPPGGKVLDLFFGSGSTGKGAVREGFEFVGIDKDEDEHGNPAGFLEIAAARIRHEIAAVKARIAAASERASTHSAQQSIFDLDGV